MVESYMVKMDVSLTFKLLYLDDIWICDSGALSHSSKSKRGAKNMKESSDQSLGHTVADNTNIAIQLVDFIRTT